MPKRNPFGVDLARALLDPASAFSEPEDVLTCRDLQLREMIEILCRWSYDATGPSMAEEEGMEESESIDLARVLDALNEVRGGFDTEHTAPTKHATSCVL